VSWNTPPCQLISVTDISVVDILAHSSIFVKGQMRRITYEF
jgi:hypothetical protein